MDDNRFIHDEALFVQCVKLCLARCIDPFGQVNEPGVEGTGLILRNQVTTGVIIFVCSTYRTGAHSILTKVVQLDVAREHAIPCIGSTARRTLDCSDTTCDRLNFGILHLLIRHVPSTA